MLQILSAKKLGYSPASVIDKINVLVFYREKNMAWETRSGRKYYYRSERAPDGRVRKVYLGSDEKAYREAALVEERKRCRIERADAIRNLLMLERTTNCIFKNALTKATNALDEVGFHNPGGRGWRRQNSKKDEI